MSDPEKSGTNQEKMPDCQQIQITSTKSAQNEWKTKWNKGETCGNRETKKTGTTLPLPGILDHRDFERSHVSLGHCTICDKGPAVYQSKTQRAAICETCYARIVREWNLSEGVR